MIPGHGGGMARTLDLTSYTLTFDDEFNAFSWNGGGAQGTWNTTYSYGERKLNDELQFYSDPSVGVDPFSIQGGALVITAAPSADPARTWNQPYTSGVITTCGTFAQQCGYFEMRAQLPAGQGLWPAFWLLPVEHVWPPEIDVVEAFGSQPYRLHWAALTSTDAGNVGDWVDLPASTTAGYHRYGVAWTAATLTYYFDGIEVAEAVTPADFDQPMYLIANLAVGGHWPGDPTPGTAFPAEMRIDYIRAYSDAADAVAAAAQPVSTPDAGLLEAPAAPRAAPPRRTGAPTAWIGRDGTLGTPGNDHFQTYYGDTATRAGGAGDDTYVVTDSRMDIREAPGEGTDGVEAWIDYTLPPEVENIRVAAGWGLRVTGNAGSNYVAGNVGDDTLSGGLGGDDVLTGGGGRDTFIVAAGGGRDTITDFQPGDGPAHGTVLLDGFDLASPEAALAALRTVGADVLLPFDNGESLTFWNAAREAFTAVNFALGAVTGPPAVAVADAAALAPASRQFTLNVSEDAYLGDAQFTVTIDGRPFGGVRTATADHAAGRTQPIVLSHPFGDGPHTVEVRFLNDASGGPGQDRNLYLDSVDADGVRTPLNVPLYYERTAAFQVETAAATLDFTDAATGIAGTRDLAAYSGPVESLRWQGRVGGDGEGVGVGGVAVATHRPDAYIATGAGDDAIQVFAGRNVLDGGGGSNFLVGGVGADTFFLDARGGSVIWDTVVNFHPGDAVTLWGFKAGNSLAFDAAAGGAPGYEGATLRAEVGGLLQSVTFAGLSPEEASRLAVTTGRAGGLDYLLIQSV